MAENLKQNQQQRQLKNNAQSSHFRGSSFGRNSVPTIQKIFNERK